MRSKRPPFLTDESAAKCFATNWRSRLNAGLSASLESKFHGKLGLQRIADTLAQEAVKVKQSRRDQRIDVVAIVEAVEHLKRRREHVAVTEVEWPAAAPVKGEEA